MFSSVFSGLRPWHGWELISFTLRETDSVMKAERALRVLRAGDKVPTRAACTLLLPLAMPAASAFSMPCPSHLAPDSVLTWRTPSVSSASCRLCPSVIPFSYSSVPWSGHPTSCFRSHLPPPRCKSLASYLCNHLLATGRNLVLHCSFPRWGSPSSCGYGFANQCCLWLARVCAVLQLVLLSAKELTPGAWVVNPDFNFPVVFGEVLCWRDCNRSLGRSVKIVCWMFLGCQLCAGYLAAVQGFLGWKSSWASLDLALTYTAM